ncbi:hypothetical protein BDQ17DRAFT_1363317 [Cyathus striatus]|nr:hypothetical protein BDQ17DRAFT_1363317 [Cyathus striatus]
MLGYWKQKAYTFLLFLACVMRALQRSPSSGDVIAQKHGQYRPRLLSHVLIPSGTMCTPRCAGLLMTLIWCAL